MRIEVEPRRVLAVGAVSTSRDNIYGDRPTRKVSSVTDVGGDFKAVFDSAVNELKKKGNPV